MKNTLPDKTDILINLIKKTNDSQDKKMNQMMGMINDLHEGLFRLEKKVNMKQDNFQPKS